jgi:sensor histidine kinase YesM
MEATQTQLSPGKPAARGEKAGLLILRDVFLIAATLTTILTWVSSAPYELEKILRTFFGVFLYAGLIMTAAHFVFTRLWTVVCEQEEAVQWVVFVVVMVAISGAGSVVGSAVAVAFNLYPGAEFGDVIQGSFKMCVLVSLVFGVNEVAFDRLRTKLEDTELKLKSQEVERERTLKLASEARLGALESRLHPHFLFNALNSVSSLIQSDPKRAERLVERIAALLRFSLESHKGGLVDLEQELRIVRGYLEIEQARLGQRLRYDVLTEGNLEGLRLPPLSIQTLVENSIKFAIAPSLEGGEIHVRAVRNPAGELLVDVSDTGPGFDLRTVPAGHGLDNLQNRLGVLFGERSELSVIRKNGRTIVRMKVPA